MCGIAGSAWTRQGAPLPHDILVRMTDALRHRGPDDSGHYESPTDQESACSLGHRRLSIIDLGGGHQPLSNEDQTVWIAFNGEIYNFRELREELIAKGHRFSTSSDTEVIVHLYEEDGINCLRNSCNAG